MFRSRLAEATLIGSLTGLACFCALNAKAGETYTIVAQSNRSSAATGCRPLSERIAAANLPLITQSTAVAAAAPRETTLQATPRTEKAVAETENMAVAAVPMDHVAEAAAMPPPKPGLWPFELKWPTFSAKAPAAPPQHATSQQTSGSGRGDHRQAAARSSGKGLNNASPASTVTR